MSLPSVYFGGSRSLSSSYAPFIGQVVRTVIASGCAVRVGCAVGADSFVIRAALHAPSVLSVFAVGNAAGQGFPSVNGFQSVSLAAQVGSSVSWSAGGGLHVPLRARLIQRSCAGFAGASQAVFFLVSPSSPGSLAVAAKAAAAGLPVFAFCCGFSPPPSSLPGQVGGWVHVGASSYYGCFPFPCFRWQSAQTHLF